LLAIMVGLLTLLQVRIGYRSEARQILETRAAGAQGAKTD
jgi:hypothetical protein